jgi:hypothetical protein
VLEEPPKNLVFILITTDAERLPLTVTSRWRSPAAPTILSLTHDPKFKNRDAWFLFFSIELFSAEILSAITRT